MTLEEQELLKENFHNELLALCDRIVVETKRKYNPKELRRMILEKTGYLTACHFLDLPPSDITSGLGTLFILNKSDLSLETFVQEDPWHNLFSSKQLSTAKLRLKVPGTKGY